MLRLRFKFTRLLKTHRVLDHSKLSQLYKCPVAVCSIVLVATSIFRILHIILQFSLHTNQRYLHLDTRVEALLLIRSHQQITGYCLCSVDADWLLKEKSRCVPVRWWVLGTRMQCEWLFWAFKDRIEVKHVPVQEGSFSDLVLEMPIDSHQLIQLAKFKVKFSFSGRCQTLSQADRVTNRLLQFLFDCCLLQTCHIQAIKICLFPKGCLVHLLLQDALVSEGHQV